VEAAGVGRLDQVRPFFDVQDRHAPELDPAVIHTAFRYGCYFGRDEVVAFLVARGVDLAGHDGDGQTGLHYAAMGGRLDTIKLLLRHRSTLEAVNRYGGTVLGQALWSAAHGGDPRVYGPIVETLIAAGAQVPARHPPVNAEVDAVLSRHGSVSDESLWWYGEEPRKQKP
jgi:ankyrin repeat protein